MKKESSKKTKQQVFQEMVMGVLVYAVVLGFFNDYTDILATTSYSTTFLVAIVMQLLTYGTFMLKDWVVAQFRQKAADRKILLGFSVWFIVFVSKFVFLAVIDVIFGDNVEISGFIGLLVIIIVFTIAQKLIERVDTRLAEK